jgi:inner membrane protein
MDTLTQIALGATIGQAVGARRLGRLAAAAGAVGGLVPDLDVLVVPMLGPLAEWQHHRGITHSLFFGPLLGPLLGWASWRLMRARRPASPEAEDAALGIWIRVWLLALLTHPLLDLFTVYGTQLLAPFAVTRFAVPAVAIIDPAYTIVLVVALLLGWRARAMLATRAAVAALALSTLYLFIGWSQNDAAERIARAQLAREGKAVGVVEAYPTIFQAFLRRVVVEDRDGVRIGFVSTLAPDTISWTCLARVEEPRVNVVAGTDAGRILAYFAAGRVWPRLVPLDGGGVEVRLTDLRYGVPGDTVAGWWGIQASVDAHGRLVSEPRRIQLVRELSWDAVRAVFRASAGDVRAIYDLTGAAHVVDAGSSCIAAG